MVSGGLRVYYFGIVRKEGLIVLFDPIIIKGDVVINDYYYTFNNSAIIKRGLLIIKSNKLLPEFRLLIPQKVLPNTSYYLIDDDEVLIIKINLLFNDHKTLSKRIISELMRIRVRLSISDLSGLGNDEIIRVRREDMIIVIKRAYHSFIIIKTKHYDDLKKRVLQLVLE